MAMLDTPLLSPSHPLLISKAFKRFAKHSHAMYMGHVQQHAIEYHLVRGFTASNTYVDTDHCIGSFLHHDFIILCRQEKKQKVIITEIDLHVLAPLNHYFIVPNSIDRALFDSLITHYPTHRHAPYSPSDTIAAQFKHNYSILTAPQYFVSALQSVSGAPSECIVELKSDYVYEIIGKSLFVYNFTSTVPTEKTLELQVKFAATLATTLER